MTWFFANTVTSVLWLSLTLGFLFTLRCTSTLDTLDPSYDKTKQDKTDGMSERTASTSTLTLTSTIGSEAGLTPSLHVVPLRTTYGRCLVLPCLADAMGTAFKCPQAIASHHIVGKAGGEYIERELSLSSPERGIDNKRKNTTALQRVQPRQPLKSRCQSPTQDSLLPFAWRSVPPRQPVESSSTDPGPRLLCLLSVVLSHLV